MSYDLRQQAYNNDDDDDNKQQQQRRYVFITRMRKASTGNGEKAMAEAESVCNAAQKDNDQLATARLSVCANLIPIIDVDRLSAASASSAAASLISVQSTVESMT